MSYYTDGDDDIPDDFDVREDDECDGCGDEIDMADNVHGMCADCAESLDETFGFGGWN